MVAPRDGIELLNSSARFHCPLTFDVRPSSQDALHAYGTLTCMILPTSAIIPSGSPSDPSR